MSNSSIPITSSTPFTSSFQATSSFAPLPSSSFVSSANPNTSPSPSTAAAQGSSIALITSVVTESAANGASTAAPVTVLITSTAAVPVAPTTAEATSATTTSSSSSSSGTAALATSSASSSNKSSGLSTGGKIGIAVAIPLVVVALLIVAGIWFWKKRKAKKNAEEMRRKEVEEYGFNPNNDPTLPPVGSNYGETGSEMVQDDAGYRGWGTTSTQRQPSTNLSSGRGPPGMAISDEGSNPGGYNYQGSPSEGTQPHSEQPSNEPLVDGPNSGRPVSGDSETIGALGAGPMASGGRNDRDIHRGPSNASSAYSGPARSEGSDDLAHQASGGQPYYEDGPYYSEAQPQHGPYGDGTYGGSGQPVIRDVQARRNTQIQKPSVFPQQGNAGIAQNF